MAKPAKMNAPQLWTHCLPRPHLQGHKYNRGHVVILAAPELTGATQLAAHACSRIGAGLTTVLAPVRADIYRTVLPADIMVRETATDIPAKIAVTLGGSGGLLVEHRDAMLDNVFASKRVFDAGAIPGKADFSFLDEDCVLTPHAGEFEKAFHNLTGPPEKKASAAAEDSGAVIVLKGPQTVIAAPDGRVVTNDHASPYLAKAGTGDVLAGMIAGLIAQNMPVFDACCAAVWMHGEAAIRFGPGLIASDIADQLPTLIAETVGY